MKLSSEAATTPELPHPRKPGRSGWDAALLLATAVGVIFVLALVTALLARFVLNSPWILRIPPAPLAFLTFVGILITMVLCFLAFFRGRRDAKKPFIRGGVPPHPEHAVVRTRVDKTDDRGRPVKAGTVGTIVHVHSVGTGASPAYAVEVVLTDKAGMQGDAHLFDAVHEELELCPDARRKLLP